jgi:AcrR family transcriptional regulator
MTRQVYIALHNTVWGLRMSEAEALEARGREAERQQLRDKILASAYEEFRARSFHLATMDAIARRAACSKKTIYKLFSSKEEMFLELINRSKSEIRGLQVDHRLAPHGALVEFLKNVADVILNDTAITTIRMMMAEHTHGHDLLNTAEQRGSGSARLALEDYFEELAREGTYDFGESNGAVRMLMGMAVGAFHHELLLGIVSHVSKDEINARVERAVAIFLKGCVSANSPLTTENS